MRAMACRASACSCGVFAPARACAIIASAAPRSRARLASRRGMSASARAARARSAADAAPLAAICSIARVPSRLGVAPPDMSVSVTYSQVVAFRRRILSVTFPVGHAATCTRPWALRLGGCVLQAAAANAGGSACAPALMHCVSGASPLSILAPPSWPAITERDAWSPLAPSERNVVLASCGPTFSSLRVVLSTRYSPGGGSSWGTAAAAWACAASVSRSPVAIIRPVISAPPFPRAGSWRARPHWC